MRWTEFIAAATQQALEQLLLLPYSGHYTDDGVLKTVCKDNLVL